MKKSETHIDVKTKKIAAWQAKGDITETIAKSRNRWRFLVIVQKVTNYSELNPFSVW